MVSSVATRGGVTDSAPAGAVEDDLAQIPPAGAVEDDLAQIQAGEAVAPLAFADWCPEHAQSLCELLPAGRDAMAQELADDLGRFLGCEDPGAAEHVAWGRTVTWARRRPLVAALLAGSCSSPSWDSLRAQVGGVRGR
jgi:hypothetical protein